MIEQLREEIKSRNSSSESKPTRFVQLARLPFKSIVYSPLDDVFINICKSEFPDRFWELSRNEGGSAPEGKIEIVRPYGNFTEMDCTLTENDYSIFRDAYKETYSRLSNYFYNNTLLFVNFDLDDEIFKQLYAITSPVHTERRPMSFAFCPNADTKTIEKWRRNNLFLIPSSVDTFLKHVSNHQYFNQNNNNKTSEVVESSIQHRFPYRFLSSFEENDKSLFLEEIMTLRLH